MAKRITDAQYVEKANSLHTDEGTCEVDDNAKVSRPGNGGDEGAYVQAWVWVADSEFDGDEGES